MSAFHSSLSRVFSFQVGQGKGWDRWWTMRRWRRFLMTYRWTLCTGGMIPTLISSFWDWCEALILAVPKLFVCFFDIWEFWIDCWLFLFVFFSPFASANALMTFFFDKSRWPCWERFCCKMFHQKLLGKARKPIGFIVFSHKKKADFSAFSALY